MARTALTAVASSEAGIDLTAVDVTANTTDGNSFPWAANRKVWILNGDDAALVPTFVNPSTVGRSALPVGDLAGNSIPAAGHKLYGPFDPSYRQADGSVWVDFAGTTPTNVTIAVLD
ncbi:hypothetical protein ACBJ59_12175 [Nonomuraea sp. MTCD27]|uniref:hypothetical protein n=1 Tax=Nonomuraea sp. MTCD27 TaxID=1676747 RepID=UPI0035C073DD